MDKLGRALADLEIASARARELVGNERLATVGAEIERTSSIRSSS